MPTPSLLLLAALPMCTALLLFAAALLLTLAFAGILLGRGFKKFFSHILFLFKKP